MLYKVIAHPRYFLGGHRPSETSILTTWSFFRLVNFKLKILIVIVKEKNSTTIYENAKVI